MSKIQFTKKPEQPTEQPQKHSLQYGDLISEAKYDIKRARSMFSFLSRAAREFMHNHAELSEEEIRGFDWCMFTTDINLEKSTNLLEIAQKALRRLEDE